MTADTFDPILGLLLMGTGNDNNSWGGNANASVFTPMARAIAGQAIHAVTGGTLDLSANPPPAGLSGAIDLDHAFTGTLTSNQTLILPNVTAFHLIGNFTSGAFSLLVKTAAAPNTIEIPVNTTKMVYVASSNFALRMDASDVGMLGHFGNASVPFGWMLCNGASLVRADHPDLFAAIGTTWGAADGTHFTLPLLTDTNRFLRAGGGSGPAVGTYQSNQNLAHSHTITGAPGVGSLGTDNPGNHTHANTVGETAHAHTASQGAHNTGQPVTIGSGSAGQGALAGLTGTGLTETAVAGVTITNAAAGAHTHTITGAPSLGSLGTASSGGAEARPESAAVLICIRY